jgi:predicted RNA-binding protein YlxR (DUF448 family)
MAGVVARADRGSNRQRHIPQRTCAACGRVRPKREMIRLVRTLQDRVEVDATGKKAGRGTYLCPEAACWQAGLKRDRLARVLKVTLSPDNRNELATYAKTHIEEARPASAHQGGE